MMLKKYLQFSIAFAFIFIIEILMESDNKTARLVLADLYYLVKPLITISLMMFYAYQTQLRGRFSKRIFSGLFFGLIGDSFLMFIHINSSFFLFGLIAFLIGHICYLSAFYLDYKWNTSIQKKASWLALIVFGGFCLGYYLYLRPNLAEMKIPVMVYMFVISCMAMMAVNRKGRVNTISFNLVFFGVIAFLISDSIIAFNKFVYPFSGAGILIMSTYMIAQYLITMGATERKLKKASAMNEGE